MAYGASRRESPPFAIRDPLSVKRKVFSVLCRPGGDLLSHVLRQSTIGAKAFDGRVRDGIGSYHLAKATRPAKNGEAKLVEDDRVFGERRSWEAKPF